MKCYLGVGHEREEVASIDVGGYFGETALLHDLPIKVQAVKGTHRTGSTDSTDSTNNTCSTLGVFFQRKGDPATTTLLRFSCQTLLSV